MALKTIRNLDLLRRESQRVRENKFKLKFEIKKPVEVYSSGFFINFNSFYII